MADDLALLFKLRADNAQAKATIADTRAAVGSLRTTFSNELSQMQAVSSKAFGSIQSNLTGFIANIPGGNIFVNVASGLRGLTAESAAAGEELAGVTTAATGVGAEMAAIAGPIGIAVLAVGAMAAGAFALTKTLFGLAEQAADFRGKLFDLSQQTGLSVETLSALEIVAKTTGGSLEGIAASLGIFQKNLDSIDDPTSKASKALKELGVNTSDTEVALRQTLTALSKMSEGSHQTALALEVFGRGGKSILAILKETQGDLDGTIDKLREMGLIVSREDAEAADKFNDQLALLQFQFRSLLGKEVIPAALEVLQTLSTTLKDNKQNIDIIAKALGSLASVIGSTLVVSLAEVAGIIDAVNKPYVVWAETLERVVRGLERIGVIGPLVAKSAALGGTLDLNTHPERASGGELDTREHQPLTEREKEQADALRKANNDAIAAAKRLADERKRDLEGQLKYFQSLNAELSESVDRYNELDTKTRVYAVSQSIANGELKNAAAGLQQMALEAAATIDQINKDIALNKELKEFQDKQNEAVRLATEGEKSFIQQAAEFIDMMRARGASISGTTEFWIRFNAAILDSKKALDMYAESLDRLGALEAKVQVSPLNADQISQAAGAAANDQTNAEAEAADAAAAANERHAATVETLRGAYEGLAGSIAQGIGTMVQNFVLLGKAGPDAFRKVVAAALASLAARAAADAIYELAIGLAALTPWGAAIYGPAVLHFQAAALLGSIAGVAAIAGRGIAGGSFAEASSASGSRASGAGGGSNNSSTGRPQSQDSDRRNFNTPVEVRLVLASGLHDVIEAHVVKNWNDNGRIRTVVQKDGG